MALFDKIKQAAATAVEKVDQFVEENKLEEQLLDLAGSAKKAWDDTTGGTKTTNEESKAADENQNT